MYIPLICWIIAGLVVLLMDISEDHIWKDNLRTKKDISGFFEDLIIIILLLFLYECFWFFILSMYIFERK